MSSKRILIFSLAYYPEIGGAEIAIKALTDRIYEIEFDLVTLCLARDCKRFERVGNVNVYRIGGGLGYLSKILFVPRAAMFARKLNSERHYDAFWAIMTYMLFPITLLRLLGDKTPYVLTLQDGDPFERVFDRFYIKIFKPLLTYGFKHANKVQAISNFLAEWARRIGYQSEVCVIPNGVDIGKFQNLEAKIWNDEISLITTSRLVEKNGVGDIIKALKFIPNNTKLTIIGSGPLEESLRMLVGTLELQNRVSFVRSVANEDIPKYLRDAGIFVRPSLSEGQGISFIEAMAAGLPVIATPVGGIPDFIKDRETGLFCKINDPKSIADKVMEYVNNPELRSRVVANARELSKRYDWNLIAGEMKSKVFNNL